MKINVAFKNLLLLFFILVFTVSCREDEPVVTPVSKGLLVVKKIDVAPAGSLFALIEVKLNYKIETEVKIDGNLFRPIVKEVKLYKDGDEISGDVVKSAQDIVRFFPHNLLDENSTYRFTVTTLWQIKENNNWVLLDAEPEVTEKVFTTSSFESPTQIIESVTPVNQSTSQSLFANPKIVFSQTVGKPFEVGSLKLKVVLDDTGIKYDNESLEVDLEWSKDYKELTISPKALLTQLSTYEIYLKFHLEYETFDNIWNPYKMDGEIVSEFETFIFTTKEESLGTNLILTENIANAYPIPNQYHFLKLESPIGFLNLNSSKQNYLFQGGYQVKARFSTPGMTPIELYATFNENENRLTHDIPVDLENETIYKIQYVRIPPGGTSNDEEEIYFSHFRTSKFNTFDEKIGSMSFASTFRDDYLSGPVEFGLIRRFTSPESFDSFEQEHEIGLTVNSVNFPVHTGLIEFEAVLDGNTWFENFIRPLLFSPWDDPTFKPTIDRDTTLLPRSALNSIGFFLPLSPPKQLTSEEIESNFAIPIQGTANDYIKYRIAPIFQHDFRVIQSKVLQKYSGQNNSSKKVRFYLERNSQWIHLRSGLYEYKIKYKLPDGTVTSTIILSMTNAISSPGSITKWDEGL